jgi:hypothetical protein
MTAALKSVTSAASAAMPPRSRRMHPIIDVATTTEGIFIGCSFEMVILLA